MPFTKKPNAEPIPGYRLIEPLGQGGFGEVWKCQAPGGLFKAIKFVYGNIDGVEGDASQASEELQAIQHVKDLRHPFLLSMDRVECVNGELMIVSELADENLHDVLQSYQGKGIPGIPREELLRYLTEAAEVFDLMNVQLGLQHLDVKPRNLFLVCNHIKVGDFGLVTSMASSGAGIRPGAVTPLYASPEVFQGKVSCASDQYSLACCYVELLTGVLPFQGNNSRHLLLQHLNSDPDLSSLPMADRPAVARALAKDPEKRHASCLDFIRALQAPPARPNRKSKRKNSNAEINVDSDPAQAAETSGQALTQTPHTKKSPETDTNRVHKGQPVLPPALAGYRLLENQGTGLLADIWKATAPDGRTRQIKFIYGFSGRSEAAIQRLLALEHPALARFEVVQIGPGWLVLVNDCGKETVRERWQKCQALKLPGIPRLELLGYMRTVAEMIDYLYQQHSLSHLGLNPKVLLLTDSGLQVADFGLAHLLWVPDGQPVAQRNARYSAPELFERQIHRTSDQYSLAIIYYELLAGQHPYSDKNGTIPAASRANLEPTLDALTPKDRDVIMRALDPDPQQRWPSCLDLIRALEEGEYDGEASSASHDNALQEVISSSYLPPLPQGSCTASELQGILSELIGLAGGTVPKEVPFGLPKLSDAGDELHHEFRVGLPVGATRVRVDAFRQSCDGVLLREDEESYEFHVAVPANFWQQWVGWAYGLEICVRMTRPHALSATPIDVSVTVKAVRCSKIRATQLLRDLGSKLLDSLRTSLLVNSEKRTHDRLLWVHPIEINSVNEDGTVGPSIMCRGKDISLSGVGFYLPHSLPTSTILIHLSAAPNIAPLAIPASVVRAKRCSDGWYDVGALFHLSALQQSYHDLETARR